MPSSRRYTHQPCANPECNALFTPHDRRQVYCTRQCQQNRNNDIKNDKAIHIRYERAVRESDAALALLYKDGRGVRFPFSKTFLLHNKVDLSIGRLEQVPGTEQWIRWYVSFGLTLHNSSQEEYWIVEKKNYEVRK